MVNAGEQARIHPWTDFLVRTYVKGLSDPRRPTATLIRDGVLQIQPLILTNLDFPWNNHIEGLLVKSRLPGSIVFDYDWQKIVDDYACLTERQEDLHIVLGTDGIPVTQYWKERYEQSLAPSVGERLKYLLARR
jgi:hypothetical protein